MQTKRQSPHFGGFVFSSNRYIKKSNVVVKQKLIYEPF